MDAFFDDEDVDREMLVDIRGMIKEVGTGADRQVVVDTKTEPAIINGAVAYKGKDLVFARGKLDIFNMKQEVDDYDRMPFFNTLFVKGDGTLSVANSGFVFHKGEWTLDFFNGFEKTLGDGYTIAQAEFPEKEGNEEDDSLNGGLQWAAGALGDRLNPLRQLMIQLVYFNKQSLFAVPNFTFAGFGISFNDFILRPGGVSFGGAISLKVLEAEVRNVVFNDKGFVGIDASLKFDLNKELGLLEPDKPEGGDDKEESEGPDKPKGEITVVHYVQPVDDVSNEYGIEFSAQLKNMVEIEAELSFKQVDDGRILPDTIAFGTTLKKPGVLIAGATYMTALRGAVRELADTIAGGTAEDPFPLIIEAGVSLRFGVAPAYHFGDIDLTLKRTGIAIEGKLDFSPKADPEEDDLFPMITKALLEAQWVTPWFVRLEAENPDRKIDYRDVAPGVQVLNNGTMEVGIGGITVTNGGRVHEIPLEGITGNAIIEMEYTDREMPRFTLKDETDAPYPVVFDNTNTNPAANAFTQFIPAAQSSDKVDHRKVYMIVPQDLAKDGGTWTLAAESAVETRLINVPTVPQLQAVSLAADSTDANKFMANWTVNNAGPGDTVNLYLTKDAGSVDKTTIMNGQTVLEPGDPGLQIAKDLPVANHGGTVIGSMTNGSLEIDVTQVPMLGDVEDIRGLLRQGDYYLRAELKSGTSFGTKTSSEKFAIIDPLAPLEVSEVDIEPAGNGYFALSFMPAPKKPGQEDDEHRYVIQALQEQDGELSPYPNFGELMFTDAELADYWHPSSGKYEGILLGGWTAMTSANDIDHSSLEGQTVDQSAVKHVGLQVGREYRIGVSAVVKPGKEADKNENNHFANRIDSAKKLLPIPVKPGLEHDAAKLAAPTAKIDMLTNDDKTQSIELYSDQRDVEVEAFYNGQSIGQASLHNDGQGSHGHLSLVPFTTDGTYAVELVAKNTKTRDKAVRMLYLTVDTIAPVLYLDEPSSGARTSDGKIRFVGRTSNDADLKVVEQDKETAIHVGQDGRFSAEVIVESGDPTVELAVQAHDGAGNQNEAVIVITNDRFNVPAGIVIKQLPVMKNKIIGTKKQRNVPSKFTDLSPSHWAYEDIMTVVK